jgi:hypothetical protein
LAFACAPREKSLIGLRASCRVSDLIIAYSFAAWMAPGTPRQTTLTGPGGRN